MNVLSAGLVANLARSITIALAERAVEPKPVAVVQQGVAMLSTSKGLSGSEKKQLLVAAIQTIARGPDGISGTADDVIPPFVLAGLVALIESELLGDVIDLAHSAFKQRTWNPKCLLPCTS